MSKLVARGVENSAYKRCTNDFEEISCGLLKTALRKYLSYLVLKFVAQDIGHVLHVECSIFSRNPSPLMKSVPYRPTSLVPDESFSWRLVASL